MLDENKKVNDNNLLSAANLLMVPFERLKGKHVDRPTTLAYDVSTRGSPPVAKQSQYGMPFNYYNDQNLYSAANQAKFVSLGTKTNRNNLGGIGTTLLLIHTYTPNSDHIM